MTKFKGYFCLLLHAHLPFVRHPEEEYFLEENWLYETITETYIPLIEVFERLIKNKVNFRITMSLTPTLVSMLTDQFLQNRYLRHINKLIELAQKEIERTAHQSHFHDLALMYHCRLQKAKELFAGKYKRNIVSAFKNFQDMGYLEIIACCATHGFLPLLSVNHSDVRAQINIGVEYYTKTFGRPPRGIWLPECGYYPGIDKFLKEAGIRYFFLDSHGILNADPVPRYSVYAPIYCPTGVAAFGRDWESSKQVWSSKEGYPGDPDYREYYKDIGHELDYEYIKPYIHPCGIRINTGLKYWRITGKGPDKEVYAPDRAKNKAEMHAENFIFSRQKQIENLNTHMDRRPIITAPYDAELFGHWWFEGPMWIEFLAKKIFYDQDTISMITPSEYLHEYSTNQMSLPSASSWGYKGYNEFWVEGSNDWLYRHLHKAGERMKELAGKFRGYLEKSNKSIYKRALNQAARELLLAQASDWAFIMRTGTTVSYAHKRIKLHINRFTKIYDDMLKGTVDREWLKGIESKDNIFSSLDCAKYYLEEFCPNFSKFKKKKNRKFKATGRKTLRIRQ